MSSAYELPRYTTPGTTGAENLKKRPWTQWVRSLGFGTSSPSGAASSAGASVADPSDVAASPDPDCDFSVAASEAAVLHAVNIHKHFEAPAAAEGITVNDLPAFEDLTPYNVTEEEQDRLWAIEARRLVKEVTADTPPAFPASSHLETDSQDSYERLSSLADQVLQVMNIIAYDGESLLAEHEKGFCSVTAVERSRLSLDYLFDRHQEETENDEGNGKNDKTPSIQDRQDFFEFVNYLTAVLARVLCTTTVGEPLHTAFLAHIAKVAAKIKVLSSNPGECAGISLSNGENTGGITMPQDTGLRGRQGEANHGEELPHLMTGAMDNLLKSFNNTNLGRGTQLEYTSRRDAVKKMYFGQCALLRRGIVDMTLRIVVALRGNTRMVATSLTSYEICALIYETGIERVRTFVFQDQDNDFLGTSERAEVNHAASPLYLVDRALQTIFDDAAGTRANAGGPESVQTGGSVGTRISWNCNFESPAGSEGLEVPRRMPLRSMSDIITVIIPLLMASPSILSSLSEFISSIISNEVMQELPKGQVQARARGGFTAFFCLTTQEYVTNQDERQEDEAKSLSNALMRRQNLLGGKTVTQIGRVTSFAGDIASPEAAHAREEAERTTLDRIRKHQAELDEVREQMGKLVLGEKGVMVDCKLYVAVLIALCIALVGGGIAVGVTVGERIPGVDPFNVTTYCWVLAAFILLVAKSIRVHQWPWNDFLRGRVLCTTVSELSSVTGIDGQLIIAYLLQHESSSFLQTRGPFNAVFQRRSDDGFSIDVPIAMWTMLICGLIMIEVELVTNRGLVCLDLRGEKRGCIMNLGESDGGEHIYCLALPQRGAKTHRKGSNRIRLSVGKGMKWLHAVGFYGNRDAEFV
ncbi:hypothetical protein QBC34DRAFT_412904 [Podospora aff. communis PSN243]|uniref:Uncharacterized protein n=1 Tax=Podospora aff. communis PSN243 TaxID=3040156 RepID=A0AAV9GB44_9PEZI|nr:hypothetical protein QBC34DRAFT_412904 [Podospora aff. communis PSN243]